MVLILILSWLACSAPASAGKIADMIVHTSEAPCAGVLELDEVTTDRFRWTRAWLGKMKDVVYHHFTLPVLAMAPLTALTAPADVAATPFREGIVSARGKVNATIVGSHGRPMARIPPWEAGGAEIPVTTDGKGNYQFAFSGAFGEKGFFELTLGPPLGHTIRIARTEDGRVAAMTAARDSEVCRLQFRLEADDADKPAAPQRPRVRPIRRGRPAGSAPKPPSKRRS